MIGKPHPEVPRQLVMTLDAQMLEGLDAKDQAEAVSLLAQLLLEARGPLDEEVGDEDE
jgi:hypothetical protein